MVYANFPMNIASLWAFAGSQFMGFFELTVSWSQVSWQSKTLSLQALEGARDAARLGWSSHHLKIFVADHERP